MPQKMFPAETRAAFQELVTGLPKQHLRFQFRKRFGTGELLTADMMKRGAVVADRARPVTNLLQEAPPRIYCIRMTGLADSIVAESWNGEATGTIGDLLSAEEVEQGLLVRGRTAKLYAYADPTEDKVYVLRVAMEAVDEDRPKPKPKAKPASRPGKAKANLKPGRQR